MSIIGYPYWNAMEKCARLQGGGANCFAGCLAGNRSVGVRPETTGYIKQRFYKERES